MSDQQPTDAELERRLRSSLHDPVPDDVLGVSEGLFTWRTIDAELAELEIVDIEPTGVRGVRSTVLTFVVGDRVIDVEVDDRDGSMLVDLGGRWATAIDLVRPDGTSVIGSIDEVGVCRFDGPNIGAMQLVVTRHDGTSVKTRWVTI